MVSKSGILASTIALALLVVALATACGAGENPFGVKSELVTPAANVYAMEFAPDGRLFFAEQFSGNVRILGTDGTVQEEPFVQIDTALWLFWGITGLALDPDFESNHYVYVFYTELVSSDPPPEGPIGKPVLVRYTDVDGIGEDPKVIDEDFPDTPPSNPGLGGNGHIQFGPDGLLYVSIGDYDSREKPSQDLAVPMGKILRINSANGSAAPDNPFVDDPDADPRIFAYGFRKSFDFVFHPETGQLYGTDNTVGSCEELNLIEKGGNYGWADVGEFPFADCQAGDQVDAIHFFTTEGKSPGDFLSIVNVTGLAFVSGDLYPLLGDSLLACEFETKLMRRLLLTGSDFDQVAADEEGVDNIVVEDCDRDIATSPDGTVYYSNETEIRRLVPQDTGE